MPNHVRSRITAPATVLSALLGTDENGKEYVDFKRVLPCPDIIVQVEYPSYLKDEAEIRVGGFIDMDAAQQPGNVLADYVRQGNFGAAAKALHSQSLIKQKMEGRTFTEDEEALISQMVSAYHQTGYMTWFDWQRGVWGTKWNAYNFGRVSEYIVEFDTAWNAPHPVIEALAGTLKTQFLHEWADEDTGHNVGCRQYRDDGLFSSEELSKTREGYELCFKLRPEDAEYYQLVDGEYEYIDED